MHLKIQTPELEKLLKVTFPRVPTKKANLRLTVKDGSLLLQNDQLAAGTTSVEITRDGDVTLPAKNFVQIVATYKGTPSLEIEVGDGILRINALKMRL